ncbi:MAG: DUF3883 domain-containing protein [Marinobacter sp.]|uniref:DUF3883 domain-containing protein n=1 Tax=Marinobacter sp. TaxID=50741 RepID=UPI003298DEFB
MQNNENNSQSTTSNTAVSVTSGAYTADLLGNIRSHLAGLQGYDIMALELIQNADDAKAGSVIFDITDDGLIVLNSGAFSYCGDMSKQPCEWLMQADGYSCDFHRIANVGSGGKLSKSENIGRFGIGFVSTYQITDQPEIESSRIKLRLQPERGAWDSWPVPEMSGTKFFLPWATDANSVARKALGATHVRPRDIEQLTEDFLAVIRKSLLFLHHIHAAEVRRNGELLVRCTLDRDQSSELALHFSPENITERWHIIRGEAEEEARLLSEEYERLKSDDRSSRFAIALKLEPGPLENGLLYAFLPTEQSTGLPLHINADFYPEPDRKSIIFGGNQHSRHWNDMLIGAAAKELARNPEALGAIVGIDNLWRIINPAYEISHKSKDYPDCFQQFWRHLKNSVAESRVAMDEEGNLSLPRNLFLPKSGSFTEAQSTALKQIQATLVSEVLGSYRTALNQVGTPFLTLDRLVTQMQTSPPAKLGDQGKTDVEKLKDFWVPLWSIIENLLSDTGGSARRFGGRNPVAQLLNLKCLVTEDLFIVTPAQCYRCPDSVNAAGPTKLLPRLCIASQELTRFEKLKNLVEKLTLDVAVNHIDQKLSSGAIETVVCPEKEALGDLYDLFAELDDLGPTARSTYLTLRNLPIWFSSRGLIKASEALLPGNFTDPTGQGALLDNSILTSSAHQFVSSKLGVRTQSIESFVETVLPTFFDEEGPLDESKYPLLIEELANHPSLLNGDNTLKTLKNLPILPTQDGAWALPDTIYVHNEKLEQVLGDGKNLWLDYSRLPDARSVRSFIHTLGVRHQPLPRHLVERMVQLSGEYSPDDDARRASSEAFYVLCDLFGSGKDNNSLSMALSDLKGSRCLPAKGDQERWYLPAELYSPFRSEGFESQAEILDFRNAARLRTDLLEFLGVNTIPSTALVIKHLQHCIDANLPPHETTYRILSERAKNDSEVSSLKGARCIYVEKLGGFVSSAKIYWSQQQLGRFAFTVPNNLEHLVGFFDAIGVKDSPDSSDLTEILIEIIGEYFEQSKPLVGQDRAVYQSCLDGIASAFDSNLLSEDDLVRLRQAPVVLNIADYPIHPDEILLHDSEWLAQFFGETLSQALCKLAPELWDLAEALGVIRLSKACSLNLDYVEGDQSPEAEIAKKLSQRAPIVQRLLHDKPADIRMRITSALADVRVSSCDAIKVQASAEIDEKEVLAPVCPANAFFDHGKDLLLIIRPVSDSNWAPVLTALFHHLMPDESGNDISKLTLIFHSSIEMSPDNAHRHLTSFGIPELSEDGDSEQFDLSTEELDAMGSGGPINGIEENDETHRQAESDSAPDSGSERANDEASGTNSEASQNLPGAEPRPALGAKDSSEPAQPKFSSGGKMSASRVSGPKKSPRKSRSEHKEQWDRRLISYVQKHDAAEQSSEDDAGQVRERNLAIEIVSRAAVCEFEKKRGRIPEEMAQTHPGYDIESVDPETGEDRLIEVKGINGEWNRIGVGLSRLQFSNAQDYGDRYWLYVVEFVSDPENIRVHPIQSPASQVSSFMFDGNWRDVVVDEAEDPAAGFVPGVRVIHKTMGNGEILNVQMRGKVKLLPESVTLQANIPRKSPSALTGAINCRKIGCECLKRAA